MAIYHFKRRKDGNYLVFSQMGAKGQVTLLAHETGVKPANLPAAVARQAEMAKKVRDSRQAVQDYPQKGVVQ